MGLTPVGRFAASFAKSCEQEPRWAFSIKYIINVFSHSEISLLDQHKLTNKSGPTKGDRSQSSKENKTITNRKQCQVLVHGKCEQMRHALIQIAYLWGCKENSLTAFENEKVPTTERCRTFLVTDMSLNWAELKCVKPGPATISENCAFSPTSGFSTKLPNVYLHIPLESQLLAELTHWNMNSSNAWNIDQVLIG